MKKYKKILSLILVFTMMMAMSLTAFAATITVKNAVENGTYTAYKIFDVTSYTDSDGKTNYSYTTDNEYLIEWIRNSDYSDYFTFEKNASGSYNVTVSDDFDEDVAKEFAETLAAAVDNNKISELDSYELTYDSENKSASSSDLSAGYYLITSSKGTLVILDTTDVTVEEKNETPESEKTVNETSVTVGDIITYTITVIIKPGAENYIVHDVMSKNLDLDKYSFMVSDSYGLDTGFYKIEFSGEDSSINDDCTFEIIFDKEYLDNVSNDVVVIITYLATVNSVDKEYVNKAWLEYGDGYKTPVDEVKSYTYTLNVSKVDEDGKNLSGAAFVLYYLLNGKKYYAVATDDEDSGAYIIERWTDDIDGATGLKVDEGGELSINGLDADVTYYLSETVVPDGYTAPTEDFSFEITADVDDEDGYSLDSLGITVDNTTEDGDVDNHSVSMTVENTSGTSELPSTGGMGTTILYAIGVVLILGAGVVLVSRRRMRG